MGTTGKQLPARSKHRIADYIGNKFGTRVVVRSCGQSEYGYQMWLMRCDCGDEQMVAASYLVRGRAKTCAGCSRAVRGKDSKSWKGFGDVPSTAIAHFKGSAGVRGIEWDISIEDIDAIYKSQNGKCALSGAPLTFRRGGKNYPGIGNASLDRKDSRKGYVKGNVWLVTTSINFAKQSLSVSEFIDLCRAVVRTAEASQ